MSAFLGLDGKVAVVTGGASGLGQAVARGLVREGARVVLGDIDKAGLERTAAELGESVRGQRTDVTRRDDIAALFGLCDKAFGPVEILVTLGFFSLFVLSRNWFLARYKPVLSLPK